MPDLQSELKKTLSAWEADAQQTQPDIKPKEQLNMTTQATTTTTTTPTVVPPAQAQRIFDYIVANPGKQHMVYAKELVKLGIKQNSSTSLISQLIRNNLINRDINGVITPATTQYRTIKKLPPLKQQHKPKPKKVKRNLTLVVQKVAPTPQAEGIAAIATATGRTPHPMVTNTKALLDSLSITQARALYDELSKIFKG